MTVSTTYSIKAENIWRKTKMTDKEKKHVPTSIEEAMKLNVKLDREGKLDTGIVSLPMSPNVLKKLREKSKNTESK